MISSVKLLDCTIRDGGWAFASQLADKKLDVGFSKKESREIVRNLADAKIEMIEVGTVDAVDMEDVKRAIYPSIESISQLIPDNACEETLFAAFLRGPDISIDKIPDWKPGLCKVIRMGIRYSEMEKSLNYCKHLCEKGYLVSIQPIVTVRYTDEQINRIAMAANEMNAFAISIVDSYGSLTEQNVIHYVNLLDGLLNPCIKIGLHAHDNMSLAALNVKAFLLHEICRDKIVDCCCLGMGRGAGNMQTEVISHFFNQTEADRYNYKAILKACDIVNNYTVENIWGYSPAGMLTALYNAAYRYGVVLNEEYGLTLSEIADVLLLLDDDMRYRYTSDNLHKLLKMSGRE